MILIRVLLKELIVGWEGSEWGGIVFVWIIECGGKGGWGVIGLGDKCGRLV